MRHIPLALAAIAGGLLLMPATLQSANATPAGAATKSPLGVAHADNLLTFVGRGGRGGGRGGGHARGGGRGGKGISRGGSRGRAISRGRAPSRGYTRGRASSRSYARSRGRSVSRGYRSYSYKGRPYSRSYSSRYKGRSYARRNTTKKTYTTKKYYTYKGRRYAYPYYRNYLWAAPVIAYGAYGYSSCEWLRRNALATGSSYWWGRYNDCVYDYY